ncbi:hypothetical protein [Pseudonocardia ailaonensis]
MTNSRVNPVRRPVPGAPSARMRARGSSRSLARTAGAFGPARRAALPTALLLGALLGTAACGTAAAAPAAAPVAQAPPIAAAPAAPPAQAPPAAKPAQAAATSAKPAPPRPVGAASGAAPVQDAGMSAAADGLRPFLLTPGEIGPSFVRADEPKPDPTVPAICGGPGVVAQFPFAVRVGAAAESRAGVVQETVSVYGDAASAAEAYRATVKGMSCSQGTVAGKPAVLAPAEDLRFDLGHEEATGWRVGGQGFDVVMIAVRDGEVVMNFTVLAPEDGLPALPDPLVVARNGVQKLLG